jgi:hypothetical protein
MKRFYLLLHFGFQISSRSAIVLNERQTREILHKSGTERYRNICKIISFGMRRNKDSERPFRISSDDQEILCVIISIAIVDFHTIE